jgi:prepilin-type N-terminal cleavage/methylation domain-containing protein
VHKLAGGICLRRVFTLIELLVVISLISLLMSILAPARQVFVTTVEQTQKLRWSPTAGKDLTINESLK